MDKAKTTIMEDLVPPPSRRSAFTLTPHPDKDQLILFGGEYFNGSKVCLYEDFMHIYMYVFLSVFVLCGFMYTLICSLTSKNRP